MRVRVSADARRWNGGSARRWRKAASRRNGSTRATSASDEDIEKFFAAAREQFGTIDFLVHSLAFADRNYLKEEPEVFTSTPREVFKQALDISAYSLIALSRAAAPLMTNGGSIIALTYLGSEKVVPGYNVMGVAKAALESTARYLAFDLGEKKSASTRSPPARSNAQRRGGRRDREMFDHVPSKSPAEPQHRRRRSRQDRRLSAQRPLQRRHRREHLRRCGFQYRRALMVS